MHICEICKKEHDGSFQSGRFCSMKCKSVSISINIKKLKTVKCKFCEKIIKECNYERHLHHHNLKDQKRQEKLNTSHICEYCGKEHKITYASGRFCSKKCAKGYSTNSNKEERKKINKKISKKLKGRYLSEEHKLHLQNTNRIDEIEKICPECGKKFIVGWNKKNKKTCSKSCGILLGHKNEEGRKKSSIATIRAIKDGRICGSGIKCNFNFNGEIIRCDSKLEYSCLNYFIENFNVKNIERSDIQITYEFQNLTHIFLPDFKIYIDSNIYVVECKSEKLSKYLQYKWTYYIETSKIKKEKLEEYCKQNNFISFWYTQNTDPQGYQKLFKVKLI